MHENMIHLVFTPHQANALAVAVKIAKEMMASVPNTPVYPATLGELERELIRAEMGPPKRLC
jgi:hypothetical protein